MSVRDVLLEFIQWCVDNPALTMDLFDDPDVAVTAIDKFLDALIAEDKP